MKPFNLQEALAGKPVVTRDDRPVTQLHLFDTIAEYPLHGVVSREVEQWKKNGEYSSYPDNQFDLFMAPTERKEWVVRVVNRVDYETQDGTSFMDGVTELTGFSSLEYANAYKDKVDALNIATKVSIHEITIIE